MTIEEALIMIENDFLEKDIRTLSSDKRMVFYQTLKEFTRAKIQRSTFEPVGSKDAEIIIRYEQNTITPHENFSGTLDESETD